MREVPLKSGYRQVRVGETAELENNLMVLAYLQKHPPNAPTRSRPKDTHNHHPCEWRVVLIINHHPTRSWSFPSDRGQHASAASPAPQRAPSVGSKMYPPKRERRRCRRNRRMIRGIATRCGMPGLTADRIPLAVKTSQAGTPDEKLPGGLRFGSMSRFIKPNGDAPRKKADRDPYTMDAVQGA